jgi:hypothetical protein
MTRDNWKTLRVPAEAYEKAKTQKTQHNRTWGEQLVTEDPEVVEVVPVSEDKSKPVELDASQISRIAEEVAEELQR